VELNSFTSVCPRKYIEMHPALFNGRYIALEPSTTTYKPNTSKKRAKKGSQHAHNVARVKPKRSFPTGNPQKAAISKFQYLKPHNRNLQNQA
jgi:hypothetical protein